MTCVMVPDFFEPSQPKNTLTPFERLENKSVLLVEDSADGQLLVRVLFRPLLTDLTIVSNGQDALDVLAQKAVDLILMDLEMPELDGFQTLFELRGRGHRTPVVALSAHAMNDMKQKCKLAGFDGFLTKPFSLKSLERILIENLITIHD